MGGGLAVIARASNFTTSGKGKPTEKPREEKDAEGRKGEFRGLGKAREEEGGCSSGGNCKTRRLLRHIRGHQSLKGQGRYDLRRRK